MDFTNRDSSSSASKSDGSDYLESWFDPELSFGITIRRIGAGLENLGNTCYLNSVLQCLTYTEPLAAYLQSGKHQISCRIAGFCALCAIQKHVSRALQSTGRILAPKDLVSNLRCISRNFRNSRQEDAHEYMISLLESMHKCCLPKGVPSESPNAYENSLVHKIFGGRLRSQVRCMQCSYCSDKYDPFLDLSLEISETDSLYKALMHFISKEQLDGGEKNYQCQGCKQKVRALKQLTIDKAPYVLTMHLKRFHAYDPGQKINKRVQFDATLNLKPFVSGSYEGDLKYTLYGVLVHAGSDTRSGHYYSFVRTASGTWYSVDDNQVFPVDQRIVLEQKAYMLFYYRDRGNVVPKKHVHIVRNENMDVFGLRNGMLSNYGLRGPAQDNSLEKRLSVTELNVCPMKDTQMKNEASFQKQSCLVVAETKVLKKDTDLKSLMQPLVQDLLKEISVMDTSAAIKKDELVASSTKETQSKDEPSSKKENTIVVGQSKTLEKETDLKFPVAPLVDNNSVNGKPGINSEMEKSKNLQLSPIVFPVKGSGDNSNLGNASVSSIEIKTSDPNGIGCFSKDSSISATTLLNSKPNIKYAIENAVTDVTCSKVNTVSNTGVSIVTQARKDGADKTVGKAAPIRSPIESSEGNSGVNTGSNTGVPIVSQSRKDDADKTVGKADPIRSPIESSKRNSEVRNIHNGADNDLKSLCGEFIETSSSPIMLNQHLHLIAPDNKLHRKVKKKVLMCHRVSMHLGTSIIFGASLSMRKKKKRMMRKKRPLENNNLTSEHFKEIDMGPSTSEKISSIQPRKKMAKSSSRDEHNDNCNNNVYNSVNDSSMDIDQHVTVPATDKLSHKRSRSCSGLAVDQCDTREPNVLKKINRESMQNDVMSMLTRGLEETIGARWDGVDLPESRAPEAKTTSIGYVGDEWDVKYDRGKRKKTKNSTNNVGVQNSFPQLHNSFQVLASRKLQLKKAKMDRSSSGNQPFRI